MTATRLFLTAAAVMLSSAAAFNTIQPRMIATRTQTNNKSSVASLNNNNEHQNHFTSKPIVSTLTALSIFATLSTTPLLPNSAANAYEESDYASETVTTVVQRLKSSTGSIDDTFLALEDVAKIITEGKGVGGQLTYDGVKLNEGYVADEDTTIYNPGLSLLTESEKERLTDAIIQNRKVSLSSNQWNENNEYAFKFLKQKLDPLHMFELGGYLKILPFWGAALYLGALFVQQNSRGIFPLVYGLCALGVFGPVIVLVAFGGP
eukprot:CAMPEP_0113412518 /NCGR_PEP_ID=MMETSP0013_2-20120614/22886_1 /TAXON_ID=2843 ORGANISM="Skeletonema costatum, Strain 1716" /NCGR_SAMPLE_ID=MMETSP0013_2 /ASSEMBLY_ACC=CAM_ASM_000158 /LENGTH=262 /DNA_ID=CAMNT_0000299033 /DNA_START=95 /DNA_END=883 /DNA_ORIENTATION=+ /assembly_acc=CAM_ASM_000158